MSKEIRRNLVIIIILAVVIGGYAFFFLSPRIFQESKENLLNTEIGREVKAGSGFSVVVEDWQYCKAEQSMAVIFSFKNSNSNPSEKIEYAAVSRNGARETKAVRCKVIYQSPTMATLTLDEVPKDFNEMAIRVKFVNKHATEDATTALVRMLSTLGKKACYIQENASAFLDSMELFFSDVKKENERGRLVYQDIFFYKDKNYAYSQNYDYLVFDYGNCAELEQLPADFYANDIRIVVCGGNAEEVAALTRLSNQLYRDESISFIFSFIDPDDRSEVLDLMGDRRERVFFAPFTPDCFRLYEDSAKLYRELLGFREEQISKSKRGFGWKRRR